MSNQNNRPWVKWYKTANWRKIRLRQLKTEPLCRMCKEMNLIEPATVCDHITPHRGNMDLFFRGPFQSLCATHHSSVKQRWEKSGAFGCDENGIVEGWK